MKYCQNCLIPDNYPNTVFNSVGVCNLCSSFNPQATLDLLKTRERLRNEFEQFIGSLRNKHRKYHCIVALSGGKDSSYLLWLIKQKYGLRVLAVTVDTGFLSHVAFKNIAFVTEKLGTDHMFIKVSNLFKLIYRYSFINGFFTRHQGLACSICSVLLPNIIFKTAIQEKIPFVMSGIVDPDNPKLFMNEYEGIDLKKSLPASLYNAILNKVFIVDKLRPRGDILPRVLYPLNTINYEAEEIVEILSKELGFKNKNTLSPIKTNCSIALLTVYLYKKRFGYNPYVNNVSSYIRWGMFDRQRWKAAIDSFDSFIESKAFKEEVFSVIKLLGIDKKRVTAIFRAGI